jgi:hypothetical protein
MFDQLLEGFRKASESSILAQQELLKQWLHQWPSASLNAAGSSVEWTSAFQRRWVETATEAMNRQREIIDQSCRNGLQVLEQSARMTEAKSPDEYRRGFEELWRKLFDGLRTQSEAQLQEMKKTSQSILDAAQTPLKANA